MCSTANPDGESECFVCGHVRDEEEIRADALAAEEAAREEARLAALEAEMRAEAERLRRAEAERRAREAAERRRRADEATARERAATRERRGVDTAAKAFISAFFGSLGAIAASIIILLISLGNDGDLGRIVYNSADVIEVVADKIAAEAEGRVSSVFDCMRLDFETAERVNTLVGTASRKGLELGAELLPTASVRVENAIGAASEGLSLALTSSSDATDEASQSFGGLWACVEGALSRAADRLSELTSLLSEALAEADSAVNEAVNHSSEKLNELEN